MFGLIYMVNIVVNYLERLPREHCRELLRRHITQHFGVVHDKVYGIVSIGMVYDKVHGIVALLGLSQGVD